MKNTRLAVLLWTLLTAGQLTAQTDAPPESGIRLGDRQDQRWKVGLIVTAPDSPCGGILGTVPVPSDWPEQQVRIVDEEISANVTDVGYRTLEGGVRQMLIRIARLSPHESATALVTFEVTKRAVLAPEAVDQFVLPRRVPRAVRPFLGASPYIEVRHPKIRALARELAQDKDGAWETVESMYDWVRDHVEYQNGALKGAVAALQDGNGDCEELTSLFIALCRAQRIPARTVWVPGHCYPEFYLQDQNGVGHWFPCQAAGAREFGGLQDFKPILQKGDNFRVPELQAPQRYVAEFLRVNAIRGGGQPDVRFVRELLPAG